MTKININYLYKAISNKKQLNIVNLPYKICSLNKKLTLRKLNMKENQRDITIDSIKGVLILLIVLEHNLLLTSKYYWIRPFCDSFALGCFFIITFVWKQKTMSFKELIDVKLKIYWPFIIFATVTSAINLFIIKDQALMVSITVYLKAIFIASPDAIKNSTGFMYLWFIPSICLLYLIRNFENKYIKTILPISFLTFLLIGAIDSKILYKTPFSFHVILFVYFLGLMYKILHPHLIENKLSVKIFCVTSFTACSVASYFVGWKLFLAGGIIPSILQPMHLLFYCFFILIAIPGLYHILSTLPSLVRNSISYFGVHSLIIYLVHPLIFYLLLKIPYIKITPFISLIVTCLLSLIVAVLIKKIDFLNNFLFPERLSKVKVK